jgi:hypothetical protein
MEHMKELTMRFMQLFAPLFMACALFAFAPAVSAQQDLDCRDYPSREAAQAELDANPEDRYNLDADDDGKACEAFDYGTGGGNGNGDNGNGGNNTLPDTGVADTYATVVGLALTLLGAGMISRAVQRLRRSA